MVPRELDLEVPTAVTVIIPCYNYRRYLPLSIGSALAQPGLAIEVIVVDDASTDGSAEYVAEVAEQNSNVRLISHSINRGHIATYNDGLEAATGDLVALLSADDVLPRAALTRAAALFATNPDLGLVYGRPVRFDAPEPPPARCDVAAWKVWPGREWAAEVYRSGRNVLLSPEAVLRTKVQHAIGGYDPGQPHAGDLAMWLRAAAVSDVGFISGPDQAFYREHGANMHSAVFGADQGHGMVTDLLSRRFAFESVVDRFDDGPAMIKSAHRALAAEALDLASRAYVWGLTDAWPVEDLIAFAADCYSMDKATPEWRALLRRRRVGRRLSHRNPAFIARERRLRRDREAAWLRRDSEGL